MTAKAMKAKIREQELLISFLKDQMEGLKATVNNAHASAAGDFEDFKKILGPIQWKEFLKLRQKRITEVLKHPLRCGDYVFDA